MADVTRSYSSAVALAKARPPTAVPIGQPARLSVK